MSTKVKGLLKGLRYISQIFDGDDREPEMQIGFPTDVKHVAHIGWDGTSVSSPSWMNEFKPSLESVHTVTEAQENSISKSKKEKPKSKHQQSINSSSPINSPTRRSKHNRSLMDSPTKGSPGRTTSRHSRKSQNSGLGNVAASQDQTASPKKSRRRKSKESKEAEIDSGFGLGSGHG